MKTTKIVLTTLLAAGLFSIGCSQIDDSHAGHDHDAMAGLQEKISIQTVEGIASGFDCAVVSVLCPSTHRAADFSTGLYTDDGKFYFVVNIPMSFMTQHFLEKLSVTGKVYKPYDHAIEPEQIYHVTDGAKKLVYESGYFYDAKGHKAMFNQGRVVDGSWVCDICAGG